MPETPPQPSYRVTASTPAGLLDRLRAVAFLKLVNREELQLAGEIVRAEGTTMQPRAAVTLRWQGGAIAVEVDGTGRVWVQGRERLEVAPDILAVKAAIFDALVALGRRVPGEE